MSVNLFQQENKYKIAVVQPGGKTSWIEEAIPTMKWGGSKLTAARYLEVECLKIEGKTIFPKGSVMILYDDDKSPAEEIMRVTIIKRGNPQDVTKVSYKGYDLRWWLLKNTYDRKFKNMTASQIFEDLCKTFEIPYGEVADTVVRFNVLHFVSKTIYDMMITALTETRKLTGKRYIIKVIEGKLALVEKAVQTRRWVIEEGEGLIDGSSEESIENMFTQVCVTGKSKNKKEISATVRNDQQYALYGIMQTQIQQSEVTTQDELNIIAAQKLKELSAEEKSGSITAVGINGVEAGCGIYVYDSEHDLTGGFYVDSDEHTYSNRHHTMSLTLAWTDELPEIDYKAPSEKT